MIQKENAFQSKVASTFRNVSGQRTGAGVALRYALDQKEENTGSADVAQVPTWVTAMPTAAAGDSGCHAKLGKCQFQGMISQEPLGPL